MTENMMPVEQFRLGRSVLQNCLILLICLSILAPPIPSGGTFPFLKVEQVLIPIFFVLYAWLLMIGLVPMFRFNGLFVVGILFTFCILMSIWYGAVALGQDVVVRDFYEIPKLWFPVAFFTIAYETKISEFGIRRLLYAYGFSILLICFYAWAQWLGLPLTQTLNGYFSGGVHDKSLMLTKRVYSTMGNPNVLGLLLSWTVVCFSLALMSKAINRLWSGLLILCSVVTIAMTASRYALLSTVGGIALVLGVSLFASSRFNRKRNVQTVVLLFVLPIVALIAIQVLNSNPHAVSRYQELQHPGQVDSLRQRFDSLWRDALADIGRSPIVGFGPAKARFSGIITDSEYLDVLKQFGIIGFGAYICFFLFPLSILWRGLMLGENLPASLEAEMRGNILVVRFTLIMVVQAMFMNVGGSTFYNPFFQGFLWLWLGVGARSATTTCQTIEAVPAFFNPSMAIPPFQDTPAQDSRC
jgi:O-antigen ligase